MSAAFINSLNNDDTLITEIKSASKIIKKCVNYTTNKTNEANITELTQKIQFVIDGPNGLNCANQCRYIKNIISEIFDLESPIVQPKIQLLTEIMNLLGADVNLSKESMILLIIDKIVLFKDLVMEDTELEDTVAILIQHCIENSPNKVFLIGYLYNSISLPSNKTFKNFVNSKK